MLTKQQEALRSFVPKDGAECPRCGGDTAWTGRETAPLGGATCDRYECMGDCGIVFFDLRKTDLTDYSEERLITNNIKHYPDSPITRPMPHCPNPLCQDQCRKKRKIKEEGKAGRLECKACGTQIEYRRKGSEWPQAR